MERQGEEVHITTGEARGGDTPHIVRYVLFIGIVLAIIALSAVWMIGASQAPQDRPGDGITNQAPPSQ